MKHKILFLILLLTMAGNAAAQQTYNMTVWRNGSYTEYLVNDVDSVTFKWVHGKLVTDITLDKTKTEVYLGGMKMLWATVLPEDAENKELVWESSNPEVAEVSESGSVAVVVGKKVGVCVITCHAADGGGAFAQCEVTVSDANMYVDLGLPSGTLWAKWNVGATSPGEYGNYFAWGETEPKSYYEWENYKFCHVFEGRILLTRYNWISDLGWGGYTDDLKELQPEDDAATANWGENWQTPSVQQFIELFNEEYTTAEWTWTGGNEGIEITSKANGNSIFLPAAGFYNIAEGHFVGERVCYWTRTLFDGGTVYAYEYKGDINTRGNASADRYTGKSIRPVRKK